MPSDVFFSFLLLLILFVKNMLLRRESKSKIIVVWDVIPCSLVDFSFPHLLCHQILLVFCLFSYPLCWRNSWSSAPSLLSYICNPLVHPVFSPMSLLLQNGHFRSLVFFYRSAYFYWFAQGPFPGSHSPYSFTIFSMLCLLLYAEEGGITFLLSVSKHPPDKTASHYGRE